MSNFKDALKAAEKVFNRNSPNILTGLGIAGFVTSILLSIKATPMAMLEYNELLQKYPDEEIPMKDKIEKVLPVYIPTIGLATVSTTLIILANRIHTRRTAALASLYALAETGIREYQEQVLGSIGPRKEEGIRGKVAQKKLEDNPVNEREISIQKEGEILCYDILSGRYFRSNIETLRQIQNTFNERMLNGNDTQTLNELYFDMGLEAIELGADCGWSVNKGLLDFIFTAKIATNNQPCVVIDHKTKPEYLWF